MNFFISLLLPGVLLSQPLFAQEVSTPLVQQSSVPDDIQIVKTYYESLFKKQDFETIATLLTDDAVYYQAEGLPYKGVYEGFAQWVEMYKKVSDYVYLQADSEPQYLVDENNHEVIIQFTINCVSKKSEKKLSMPILEAVTLRDHKIASIRPYYFDTKSFAAFLEN